MSGRLGKCSVNFCGSGPARVKMSCLPNWANSLSLKVPGVCSSKALKSMSVSSMMFESGVFSVSKGSRMWLKVESRFTPPVSSVTCSPLLSFSAAWRMKSEVPPGV